MSIRESWHPGAGYRGALMRREAYERHIAFYVKRGVPADIASYRWWWRPESFGYGKGSPCHAVEPQIAGIVDRVPLWVGDPAMGTSAHAPTGLGWNEETRDAVLFFLNGGVNDILPPFPATPEGEAALRAWFDSAERHWHEWKGELRAAAIARLGREPRWGEPGESGNLFRVEKQVAQERGLWSFPEPLPTQAST